MSEYRGRPVETHHNLAKTKKIIKQGHTTTYDGQEELVRKSECVQSYAVDSQIASEVIIMISGTTSIDIPCVTLSQIVKEEIETQRHTTGEIRCDCVLAGGRRGDWLLDRNQPQQQQQQPPPASNFLQSGRRRLGCIIMLPVCAASQAGGGGEGDHSNERASERIKTTIILDCLLCLMIVSNVFYRETRSAVVE